MDMMQARRDGIWPFRACAREKVAQEVAKSTGLNIPIRQRDRPNPTIGRDPDLPSPRAVESFESRVFLHLGLVSPRSIRLFQ